MSHPINPTPNWSTACFGTDADTTPIDRQALSAHLEHCMGLSQPLFALRCGAEATRAFLTTHVVTTGVLLSLTTAALWLVLS